MIPEVSPPPTVSRRVLIVEDLEDSRESLQELLQEALKIEVDTAADGVRGLELLAERPYALVVTDLRMPKASGMRVLREVQDRALSCAVVVMTGHGSVREAVEAMRLGAYDFLQKPLDPQKFVLLVDRVLRERELVAVGERKEFGQGSQDLKQVRGAEANDTPFTEWIE